MTHSPKDTLAIAFGDGETNLLRKDPNNQEIVLNTFSLKKFEVFILLSALLDIQEYQDEAVTNLIRKGLIRLNHKI